MILDRHGAAWLAGLAGLLLWAASFWSGPLVNDVGWQLWIGQQINAGATLYGDILEVNPPLWFWISAGIERLAALTGFRGSSGWPALSWSMPSFHLQ